jgi:POT family proton-dependent oligopeptide transporter
MVLGLIQFRLGAHHLGEAGLLRTSDTPEQLAAKSRKFFGTFFSIVAVIAAFGYMVSSGVIPLTLTQIATALGYSVLVIVGLFFVLVAIFWSGFEQAGTSLNLFARDLTDRMIFGWEAPASWLQSINPIFIIIGAPLFGSLWVWLERRNADPSIPMKAGLGLMGLAAGFFVLSWGAANATAGSPVSPSWLVVTYFLHTVGELCISPIGLSAITKLSPQRRVGQMMGIWFVGAALGNLFAGLVAGSLETLMPHELFRTVALIVGSVGIVALALAPQVNKLARTAQK